MYHNYIILYFNSIFVSQVQNTLRLLQLRLELVRGRHLSYKELAKLADTSQRTITEWMRGATSPSAMTSLLNLLSELPADSAAEVLGDWKRNKNGQTISSSTQNHDGA